MEVVITRDKMVEVGGTLSWSKKEGNFSFVFHKPKVQVFRNNYKWIEMFLIVATRSLEKQYHKVLAKLLSDNLIRTLFFIPKGFII